MYLYKCHLDKINTREIFTNIFDENKKIEKLSICFLLEVGNKKVAFIDKRKL